MEADSSAAFAAAPPPAAVRAAAAPAGSSADEGKDSGAVVMELKERDGKEDGPRKLRRASNDAHRQPGESVASHVLGITDVGRVVVGFAGKQFMFLGLVANEGGAWGGKEHEMLGNRMFRPAHIGGMHHWLDAKSPSFEEGCCRRLTGSADDFPVSRCLLVRGHVCSRCCKQAGRSCVGLVDETGVPLGRYGIEGLGASHRSRFGGAPPEMFS
ncbi:unnamed protein product [Ectocarpus sp. CCAP 1310/34]|nr:unnamed protein product [Ectocarpus sp. CCAP 1310/34]